MLRLRQTALKCASRDHIQTARLLSRSVFGQTLPGDCLDACKTAPIQARASSNIHLQPSFTQAKGISQGTVIAAAKSGVNLCITWMDGSTNDFPFIYLRDNCLCSQCLHPSSQQRLFDFVAQNTSVDLSPSEITLSENGRSIALTWPCGHSSTFDSLWLNDHRLQFTGAPLSDLPSRCVWRRKELESSLPQLCYRLADLLCEPILTRNWLLQLHKFGITFVTHAGTSKGVIKQLVEHVAFLQRTSYGETYFVESVDDANNLTYTSAPLALHLDMPYLDHPPGIVLLHCLRQPPDSGHTFFSDGFAAALRMEEDKPELFRVLCNVDVTWRSKGFDKHSQTHYHHESKHPVFQLNNKELVQVFFGSNNRASQLDAGPTEVYQFYKAFQYFGHLCAHYDWQLQHRLAPGEIVVFDNRRIVHGRGGLNTDSGSIRCLEGGYCAWDDILSQFRVLSTQLSKTD